MTAALGAMGGKWNLIVLYWLDRKPCGFNELRRLLPTTSQKVLTQALRDLQANGLVLRASTASKPPRVTYSLSEHGVTLSPVVEAIRVWGHAHMRWRGERGMSRKAH